MLGDCYYVCCLSALAEFPGLVARLFDDERIQANGGYKVWLNINGVWTEMILDDYFPAI
jgi:calpain-15